ncbi:S8 family peptidase [Streptomyces sp. NBC_00234]|uniref:S8 family peptidase n=1 Tax=Streptomyces sp. NBC_00234 TaxID=2903638 RepID=UPI002E28C51D|nr:S8 family serine peptidase [Streptomyces sp. NBC_00234]
MDNSTFARCQLAPCGRRSPRRPGPGLRTVARPHVSKASVTKLVEYGYDDAHRPAVPLMATFAGKPGKAGKALRQAAPAGSVKADELPSANAVALRASKKKAATFWEAVDYDGAATTAPKLAHGIKKLWLDRPVQVTLDQSVPQIGAPEAWAAGYDGTGTKVAVLETGIDPNHPDVAGRVKQAQNFTDDPDAVDHHGHGTHVASTVVGSGAASGGAFKGVAPGADLYIGKVLNSGGSGPQSGVIAGMEWAVAQGADDFDLAFALQTGATPDIDGVEVEVSTDDGATWSPATVKTKTDGNYKVSVRNPSSGHVSLRVEAQDANGSKIEQTLIRAYAVR